MVLNNDIIDITSGNTTLFNFIRQKIENYIEPPRVGIPRKKLRGYPKEKELATLYGLTNIMKKDIAKAIGVSEGLERKWHTEDEFKEKITKYTKEYAETFIEYWIKKGKEFLKQTKGLKYYEVPIISFEELIDSHLYSIDLVNEIIRTFNKRIKDNYFRVNPKLRYLVYRVVKIATKHQRNAITIEYDPKKEYSFAFNSLKTLEKKIKNLRKAIHLHLEQINIEQLSRETKDVETIKKNIENLSSKIEDEKTTFEKSLRDLKFMIDLFSEQMGPIEDKKIKGISLLKS
jgi:hypothetical protein